MRDFVIILPGSVSMMTRLRGAILSVADINVLKIPVYKARF